MSMSHSFFAQQDYLGVSNYVTHFLNFICDFLAMIGTSDQSCCLAKACKFLLLLAACLLSNLHTVHHVTLHRAITNPRTGLQAETR